MYANTRGPATLMEGWLERWTQGKEWKTYWCVLRDEAIFFYDHQQSAEHLHVDCVHLGPDSRLDRLNDKDGSGYTFQLQTKGNKIILKSPKYTDREYWKAFVEGIAFGRFSDSIDLLPGQKEEIRNLLNFKSSAKSAAFYLGNDCNGSSGINDTQDYLLPVNKITKTSHLQKYRFYADSSRMDIPSWFFSECSRQLAEKILTEFPSYGNTLMRISTNGDKNLVISKRMDSVSSGQEFTHYVVKKTPKGYIVDVVNVHEPMQSLTEVMDFFIATSGKTATRPMTCNNLHFLGLELPYGDYNKWIPPSLPDIIAPPVPHVYKTNSCELNNTADSGKRKNSRSVSVPNINAHDPAELQAMINRVKIPPVEEVPPPLPPNHPTAQKNINQSETKNSSVDKLKRSGPKHTQSMSSADGQARKISPRDQNLSLKAKNELKSIAAKFNQQNEEPEGATLYEEPENTTLQTGTVKSPKVVTESFKKELEGLFKNLPSPYIKPQTLYVNTNSADEYENVGHYQNVSEINQK